jgi:hypothetical protein
MKKSSVLFVLTATAPDRRYFTGGPVDFKAG